VKKYSGIKKAIKQGWVCVLVFLFAFNTVVFANPLDEMETPAPEEPAITVPLWNDSMVADRTPTRQITNIRLRGVFPDIQPHFGEAYEELNAHISATASDLIDSALRLRARTITFSYQVEATPQVVSVVMYAAIAAVTLREAVRTINFCPQTGKLLTITCVMGDDFPPLVERILTQWTRDYPERFYSALTAPISAFYITHTQLVFLFDEFQISTDPGGVTRLEMTLANIIRLTPIAPTEYRVLEDIYNLKMVPIRNITQALGFDHETDSREGRVRIWRDIERTEMMMEINKGVNAYHWGGSAGRALESSPMLLNGRVLVPITFFDQIMPRTTYRVDDEGYIHFLSYNPRQR